MVGRYELNFGGVPSGSSDRVGVLPVPYDHTASYQSGTRWGPEAVIRASAQLELYDEVLGRDPSRLGIQTHAPLEARVEGPRAMLDDVRAAVLDILSRGQFPVILGGDHAITVGAVEALAARHDRLTVLQLDAHADLRDSYQGSPWSHACVMRRVREICPAVSVGVRSYSELEAAHIRDRRLPVIGPGGVRESRGRFAEMLGALSESVYVTVDADVFDPAIMPATGTPEPGGLTWDEVDSILAWVCENRHVVGFDVVELMPIPGFVAPEYILARLIYRTIGRALTAGAGPDARA